ncbi:MAG: extracellular solute-binding protein [Anaerolineales bacterium]|nr:extracellular solute-binding protein [Anaerolineales bacterium]
MTYKRLRSIKNLIALCLVVVLFGLGLIACQAEEAPTASPAEAIGGNLDFISWEGYDLSTCMRDWEEEHGVTMSSTYIGDHSEIQAKLSSAQDLGYDLITYYQGYSDLYRDELKIIQPLDRDRIPNYDNLYDNFRGQDFWEDEEGNVWGVPFTWGAEGSNYNADITEAPASWTDLLEPEFKDRVGMVDDMNGAVIIAGRILGFGDQLPNITHEQLAQIKELILQFKSQARGIAPSFGDLNDLLVSGEVIVTYPGWAAVNSWAQERGVNVQHTIPAEGGFTFIDAFAIPAGADNYDTAIAWINESLSPEVQACQAAALAAGVVNPEAVPLLDEATANLYPYETINEVFEKAPVYSLPPLESDQYATYDDWLSMWEEAKAE